jgi:hypothetical protein
MVSKILSVALLLLAPACAAGLASRPAGEFDSGSYMEGPYAAVGGGGALVVNDDGNGFGYDLEARLGYSFNPGLQIYLAAATDSATIISNSFRANQVAAIVQYHLFAKGAVGVYGRAGVGVGFSGNVSTTETAVGLAASGGLGVEFQIARNVYLAPEFFYRNASLSASRISRTVQVIGVQLALIYY